MIGPESRIPLSEALWAADRYRQGWSLAQIARLRNGLWGYASARGAAEGLKRALQHLDVPIRTKSEAIKLAQTLHGNARRGMESPDHPDHDRYLLQYRHYRRCSMEKKTTP